jgi:hypothetical protein
LDIRDAVDRSCNSVIYTFYANGTVTIESGIKEIPGSTFEYEYFNNGNPFCPTCLPAPDLTPNLIIGENKYYCQIAQSWLTTIFVKYYTEQETGKEARTHLQKPVFFALKPVPDFGFHPTSILPLQVLFYFFFQLSAGS